ncbi:hypothetical protein PHLGIDRAFT_108907 [Phlebiopsis gigantea 11061_1 CR5-6]|uniref:Uncharacterized protein n=1 Tax=Phlebiopsis gigantea (strain 11061_1 CR5-6) TaxID=745531 RepID=A0A0C3RUX1_PHLG1|nr:hypothetical protein PHLGIDRAFT_108907 [Phlebiopsis gigantea 11061_1 CR5-6]
MRRSQSTRSQGKNSLVFGADELEALKEGAEEGAEDVRQQLRDKHRENEQLKMQIAQLKSQLAERPSLEAVQGLQREYTNLEILLDGTQRENERCMAELERGKQREKALESQLAKLAGPNWQDNLNIAPLSALAPRSGLLGAGHARAGSMSKAQTPTDDGPPDVDATRAYIDQVRLLVIGMEQRLQTREEKLTRSLEEAKAESAKFEELKQRSVAAPMMD